MSTLALLVIALVALVLALVLAHEARVWRRHQQASAMLDVRKRADRSRLP